VAVAVLVLLGLLVLAELVGVELASIKQVERHLQAHTGLQTLVAVAVAVIPHLQVLVTMLQALVVLGLSFFVTRLLMQSLLGLDLLGQPKQLAQIKSQQSQLELAM
jgi:hypothetical protein